MQTEFVLTVTQLASRCGLSRSTVLYYESLGLLRAESRSDANYRRYGERSLRRLEQIRAYRDAGLSLEDIARLFDASSTTTSEILERRFLQIDREIGTLRGHQQSILRLLHATAVPSDRPQGRRTKVMTKEKWVEIMRAAGMTDQQMNQWHVEFERKAPEDHQKFLESLQIGEEEIGRIRQWSRDGGH